MNTADLIAFLQDCDPAKDVYVRDEASDSPSESKVSHAKRERDGSATIVIQEQA